jgi:polysaccharide biosynthesis transport protein
MGKVFDALQRAEEQRSRVAGGGEPTQYVGLDEPETSTPRRAFWKRWLAARPRAEREDASALNKRRIALLQPHSFVAEQFRSLRARIESIAASRPMHTIAVTSANAGDGKSMSAINLALVMSMSVGEKVVLVDCDLRRPRVHDSLGLRVEAGLAEVLSGDAEVSDALATVDGSTLQVLPVRSLPSNPAELLASQRMRELVQKLATQYDWVILDVPPILGLPDAKVVSDLCDATLLVVRAHVTPQEEVERALEVIDRSRLLGIAMNEFDANPERYGFTE